jgi:aspartate kinase
MIVMKFGGTSLADGGRIRTLVERVRERVDQRPLLVVSALAGATDALERTLRLAVKGDPDLLEPVMAELARAHRWALRGAVDDASRRHALTIAFDRDLEELRDLLRSIRVLGEWTPRIRDSVLAFGERGSARLVAAALQEAGISAEVVEPGSILATDRRYGAARPDWKLTSQRADEILLPQLERGCIPVLGGFVGRAKDGSPTTLGRGGSDTTAAILGCVLAAQEIQIWTDVDGIMTADPRLEPDARALSRVSFSFAAELAAHGAKVLHPASLAPAVERNIPILVRNTTRPEHPGTYVGADEMADSKTVALAVRRDVRAWCLRDPGLESELPLASRIDFTQMNPAPFAMMSSPCRLTCVFVEDSGAVRTPDLVVPGLIAEELEQRSWIGVVCEAQELPFALEASLWKDLAIDRVFGGAGSGFGILLPKARLEDAIRQLHKAWVPVEV